MNSQNPINVMRGASLILIGLAAGTSYSQTGYIVTDLAASSGGTGSAVAINDLQQILYGRAILASPSGGLTPIPSFAGTNDLPTPRELTNGGVVVGVADDAGNVPRAFIWSGEANLVDLGGFGPTFRSEAFDVNAASVAVGIARTSSVTTSARAARFSGGVAFNLASGLPSATSEARGINASGQIVGTARLVGGTTSQPVLFDGLGGATGFPRLPGYDRGAAFDITDGGLVVGQVSNLTSDTRVAVAWDATTFAATALTRPVGINSGFSAVKVNSSGTAVGSGTIDGSAARSLVYQAGVGYILNNVVLNAGGWIFNSSPNGINANGEIVGVGLLNGESRSYLLTPAPGQGSKISGTITMSNFTGPRFLPPVTFTLVPTGGGASISVPEVGTSPIGDYFFMTGATGTYDLYAEATTFIRRRVQAGLLLSAGSVATGANVILPNGDVDDSGEIDAADIDLVIASFGLTNEDPLYYDAIRADLDGSNEIDAADIDIAIANFGSADD